MKERPILFSGEMVRAILDGRKTQTRRPVTTGLEEFFTRGIGSGCTETIWKDKKRTLNVGGGGDTRAVVIHMLCPFGKVGDRLWVRETWQEKSVTGWSPLHGCEMDEDHLVYRADGGPGPWRPSIHMPRWASRITLEITDVRVQRVQEISEGDAREEGRQSREELSGTWDAIYADKYSWAANPWVWAITFRRVEG